MGKEGSKDSMGLLRGLAYVGQMVKTLPGLAQFSFLRWRKYAAPKTLLRRLRQNTASLAIAALLVVGVTGCRDANKWIISYGYTPINPASTLLTPGALIMRNEKKNTGVRLVCSAWSSLGSDFRPQESSTISGKFRKSAKMTWRVSADVLNQAKANVNASDVDEVSVTVTNAKIVHLDDEQIYAHVINRSRACQAAIRARKDAGYSISMVKSALMGDVTYNITFKNSEQLDVDAKIAQAANLAVGLGGSVDTASETTASATNLVWGIQEDMFLAAISISPQDAARYKRNTRMLPSDFIIDSKGSDGVAQP